MKIYFCHTGSEIHADALRHELPHDEIYLCAPDELNKIAKVAEVLIPMAATISAEILQNQNLKLVQQFGAGLNNVDLAVAAKHEIPVANVPAAASGNAISVAELTIFFMLALARKFSQATEYLQQQKLFSPVGEVLYGKCAGILGFGGIGQTITERLKDFGMKVMALSKSGKTRNKTRVDFLGTMDKLPDILKQIDFLIIALPLTQETHNLINAEIFAAMKPESFIINVGRGPIINYNAMLEALKQGVIAGAAFDVAWEEPISPQDPIFNYNVIATPHIGAATNYSIKTIAVEVAKNINLVRNDKPPLNCH